MGALEAFRRRRGWTQLQLAKAVGLRSKGYISAIESGREPCSYRLAQLLETLSDGELKATDLRPAGTPPAGATPVPGP